MPARMNVRPSLSVVAGKQQTVNNLNTFGASVLGNRKTCLSRAQHTMTSRSITRSQPNTNRPQRTLFVLRVFTTYHWFNRNNAITNRATINSNVQFHCIGRIQLQITMVFCSYASTVPRTQKSKVCTKLAETTPAALNKHTHLTRQMQMTLDTIVNSVCSFFTRSWVYVPVKPNYVNDGAEFQLNWTLAPNILQDDSPFKQQKGLSEYILWLYIS